MVNRIKHKLKGLGIALAGSLVLLAFAFSPSVEAIARGYTTDDQALQTGMVVALSVDAGSSDKVERASQDNSTRVVGVVTTLGDSLVTVSSGNAKVLVESEGQVHAYVSDIQGQVKKGDLLAISPFRGILMKADSATPSTIIGIAEEDSTTTSPYTYTDGNQSKQTKIANILINLNHQGANTGVAKNDSALAKLSEALVGKNVGELRVAFALIIFVIVLIAEGGVLYGAISSSMTALGRNPLAKKIIRGETLRVVVIALIVLTLGLAAVYAILWV